MQSRKFETVEEVDRYWQETTDLIEANTDGFERSWPTAVHDLAQTYLQFRGAKGMLRDMIREREDTIASYVREKRSMRTWIGRGLCDIYINTKLEEIKKLKSYVRFANVSKKKSEAVDYRTTEDDRLRARAVPITDFIEFDRSGFSPCIFHLEKTGSMKYYKGTNSVYCFGCQQKADSIAVIMQLQKTNFKNAIKFLMNK